MELSEVCSLKDAITKSSFTIGANAAFEIAVLSEN
jgi:hypothetical protein